MCNGGRVGRARSRATGDALRVRNGAIFVRVGGCSNGIVLSLHRSKSSSLLSSSFNGGGDEKDDVDGKNDRENEEFKRKDALSRKTLKIALCDSSSSTMREWLKVREVDCSKNG